jgi:hypothetical protein
MTNNAFPGHDKMSKIANPPLSQWLTLAIFPSKGVFS